VIGNYWDAIGQWRHRRWKARRWWCQPQRAHSVSLWNLLIEPADSNFLAILECKSAKKKEPTKTLTTSIQSIILADWGAANSIDLNGHECGEAENWQKNWFAGEIWILFEIFAVSCAQHLYFPSAFLISVLASCLRAASRSHFRAGERSGLNCAHLQVGAFGQSWKGARSAAAAAITKPTARRRIIRSAAQRARGKMKGSLQNAPLSGVYVRWRFDICSKSPAKYTAHLCIHCAVYLREHTHTWSPTPLMCVEDYSKFAGFLCESSGAVEYCTFTWHRSHSLSSPDFKFCNQI
jgi:hypothetical protein